MRAVAVHSERAVKLAAPSKVNHAGWASAAGANSVDDMAIIVEKQHLPPSAERHRRPMPWSPRAWRQAVFVAAAIPAQVAWVALFLIIVRTSIRPDSEGRHQWPVLLALLPLLLLLPVLTWIHRQRLRVTAGVPIPSQPARTRWPSPRTIASAARSQAVWRQVSYHLLAAPVLAAAAIVAIGSWLAGIAFATIYSYSHAMPPTSWPSRGLYRDPSVEHLPLILGLQVDAWLTLAGVALLFAAPWLTAGVQALDVRAARAARPEPSGGAGASRRGAGRDQGRGGGRGRRRAPPPRARPA